jgi:hypothetical protein
VLGVLGGTTWFSGGFWAPDGEYSRFISPLLLVVWVLAVSRVPLDTEPCDACRVVILNTTKNPK